MQRFVEDENGEIHETSVKATVAHLREFFPDIDATSLEAHIVLERTHSLLLNMREAAWASFGLTGRRFILLRLLYTSDRRRLSMGEIASQMNLGTNNVTQLVDGMERDGLVERLTGPEDKRVVFATLTPAGRRALRQRLPAQRTAHRRLLVRAQRRREEDADPAPRAPARAPAERRGRRQGRRPRSRRRRRRVAAPAARRARPSHLDRRDARLAMHHCRRVAQRYDGDQDALAQTLAIAASRDRAAECRYASRDDRSGDAWFEASSLSLSADVRSAQRGVPTRPG